MQKGKFIVLYGTNNIGKSTQIKSLVNRLIQEGVKVQYLKYPIYDLEPTGPRLNAILRKQAELNLTPLDIQKIYAQNRRDFEPELKKLLEQGIHVIAEDYKGTGMAWGMTRGVDLEILEEMNKDLYTEDLVILLDGERFLEGIEANHLNERNDELIQKNRQCHLELQKKYNWPIVNANQSIEDVQKDIWKIVSRFFG